MTDIYRLTAYYSRNRNDFGQSQGNLAQVSNALRVCIRNRPYYMIMEKLVNSNNPGQLDLLKDGEWIEVLQWKRDGLKSIPFPVE